MFFFFNSILSRVRFLSLPLSQERTGMYSSPLWLYFFFIFFCLVFLFAFFQGQLVSHLCDLSSWWWFRRNTWEGYSGSCTLRESPHICAGWLHTCLRDDGIIFSHEASCGGRKSFLLAWLVILFLCFFRSPKNMKWH